MKLTLAIQWNTRLKLYAEGDKLYAEGSKLYAEGDKLYAEGSKLRAEGDKLYAEAILEIFGNIKLEWKWRTAGHDCKLENGEIYKWDEPIF